MELILVVVISAGMVENSQNGVSRSLRPCISLTDRPPVINSNKPLLSM